MTTVVHRHLTPLGRTPAAATRAVELGASFYWRDGASGLNFRALGEPLAFGPDGGHASALEPRSVSFEHHSDDHATSERLPAWLHALGFDPTAAREAGSPWAAWPRSASWLPEQLIVTTPDGSSFAITHAVDGDAKSVEAFVARAVRFAEAARRALALTTREPSRPTATAAPVAFDEAAHARFVGRVERAQRALACGSLSKVVLARSEMVTGPGRFDPERQLSALAQAAPRAIVFGWWHGDAGTWLGATPEVLARVGEGFVTTSAIAGTARRSDDPEGCALAADRKCLHEHALVVSAMRAALEPLVVDLVVRERPSVLLSERLVHLETPMRARLDGHGLLALARALHPTPALGGSPRDAALAWLREHEGLDRGHFGAPIGWESPSGDGVLAVGIRAALVRESSAVLFAGAGLVEGSDPEAEWRETVSKLELARSTLMPSGPAGSLGVRPVGEEARA
ncbi:MAG: isochorismate synthase [Deltaproteobacteria bacterium]|nr:isochorismate synthase [Deltaproteobacteria bacterium]